ncbi:PTS cellobiose transporter subunit IIC [Erysipelothrix larvae]|uniref:Permease IIC component n=1 Tax=Erysipelothrix larvae TaxID=1514105 RepID=A0A0X8H1M6_9FIRM|nr:PTS transporter subunit EIIC [Erysipelothrix larvae]AMC94418.1 PTS cellobiose transporter subunit IIC [Erysipelothrix larvae]
MQKFMDWMSGDFSKAMNKITRNPWVAGVQESLLTIMPVILIGSIGTFAGIFQELIPGFPDLSALSNYSFGLMSLFLAYLIPEAILTKKRRRRIAKQAGLAGIAFFMMIISPIFDADGNMIVQFGNLGSGGMIASLVSGVFVSLVMNIFSNLSFFKEDSSLPDFITVWFDTLIPIALIILFGWALTELAGLNIFDLIYQMFSPFIKVGQSFWGFVILNFLGYSFLYTFGISTWLLYPIMYAITNQAFSANQALIAAGGSAQYIHTLGTTTFFSIGGGGMTLALNIMMLRAKSKKVKTIGRSTIVPSICNINEPIIFGAPVAFNPILMIPMWINGLIAPVLTYILMSLNIVPIPTRLFGFWYLPGFISAYFESGSFVSVIYWFVLFAISWVVYYPFFKVFDNQSLAEETAKAN